MRWSRALAAPVLMLFAVVACSSPGASTGGGDDGGNGSEQSQAAEPTATSGGDDGGGDDGGSGGGTGSTDVDAVYAVLVPPNSTELSKTSAEGVIFAAFDTDESLDSLQQFYEDAFADADLEIVSTTEAQGGTAWALSRGGDSNFGGAVSVFPASDGSGTQVTVTIGSSE